MTELTRGQNTAWPHPLATVHVSGAVPVAVLAGPGGRAVDADAAVVTGSARDAVAVGAGTVTVHLELVPPGVERVVVVGVELAGAPHVVVRAPGAETVFAPGPPTVERVLLLVELYRRAGAWKLRAVGQGYAGGWAELAGVLGLDPAGPAPQPTTPPAPTATPSAAQPPGVGPVRQLGMVLDDASRSTAAAESSTAWAARRLETDLEAVVGDPALRVGPAGDAARVAAQQRHDALVAEARARHAADLRQLTEELAGLEPRLPAALARWDAEGWRQPAGEAPWSLRVGDLGLASAPDFRVPMVRPLPLHPPLWIDTDPGGVTTTRRQLAALCQRAVLALPSPPRITVVDPGGSAADVWAGIDVVPVTDPGAAARVLREHVDHLGVVALAAESDGWEALPVEHRPGRLLVVVDAPTGLDEAAVTDLLTLVVRGAEAGTSVVASGSTTPGLGLALVDALHERSLRVPSGPGGDLVDAQGGTAWVFHPDLGPADPRVAERVRDAVAQRRWALG